MKFHPPRPKSQDARTTSAAGRSQSGLFPGAFSPAVRRKAGRARPSPCRELPSCRRRRSRSRSERAARSIARTRRPGEPRIRVDRERRGVRLARVHPREGGAVDDDLRADRPGKRARHLSRFVTSRSDRGRASTSNPPPARTGARSEPSIPVAPVTRTRRRAPPAWAGARRGRPARDSRRGREATASVAQAELSRRFRGRRRRRQAVAVLRPVEVPVGGVPLLDRPPPVLVLAVPAHGFLQALVERRRGTEAEPGELPGVERVAPVVARDGR